MEEGAARKDRNGLQKVVSGMYHGCVRKRQGGVKMASG